MWKRPVEDILNKYLPAEAVSLCIRYFSAMKVFDEAIAGRAELPEVPTAIADFLTGFIGNTFFAKHRGDLFPVAVLGYKSWAESVSRALIVKTDEDRAAAAMARRTFHEFACTCVVINGGNSLQLRQELLSCSVL